MRSRFARLAVWAAAIATVGGTVVCSQERSAPKEKQVIDPQVLEWVREAPFSDPAKIRAHPNFSYEDWFARGRKLPDAVDSLVELLEQEDPQHPSGDGMRVAYGLGWIGDKRPRAIHALIRALDSRDITLRIEAVAALGRLGDPTVLPLLERLARNRQEDKNVRGNACVSIGRLGVPSAEPVLLEALKDTDRFIVLCAQEGLKLLHGGK
jgi:HEAT repeat protein